MSERGRCPLLAAASVAAQLGLLGAALAQSPTPPGIAACDRLAASPYDPNRDGPGVPLDKIDAEPAIAACGAALAQNPDNPRIAYDLGRAQERTGRFAADQGLAPAQYNLALFFEDGLGGLPQDDREAGRLYRLAADQGDPDAQAALAVFYGDGRGGLKRDEATARRLLELAARQGNELARRPLADPRFR